MSKELPPLPKHLMIFDQSDDSSFGSLVEHAWDSDYATMKVGDPMFTADQMRDYARAALAAQPVAQAPEGMRLVPIEPTPAMLDAGQAEFRSYCLRHMYGHPAVWAAMLAAAPSPEARQHHEQQPDGTVTAVDPAEASKPVRAEAPSTIIHQHRFAADNNRLRVINESLDKQLEEVMTQRDEREDVIDKILDLVLGEDREEWSSAYGFSDAINDVDERMSRLAAHSPASGVAEREANEHIALVKRFGAINATASDPDRKEWWKLLREIESSYRAALATQPLEQKPVAERMKEVRAFIRADGDLARGVVAQPEKVAQDGGWKDHQTAAVINELTRLARKWSGTEQLRERIKEAADPLVRAARASGKGGGT